MTNLLEENKTPFEEQSPESLSQQVFRRIQYFFKEDNVAGSMIIERLHGMRSDGVIDFAKGEEDKALMETLDTIPKDILVEEVIPLCREISYALDSDTKGKKGAQLVNLLFGELKQKPLVKR